MVLSPRHQYLFSPQYFDTRTMIHHWGTSPWVELETHLREVWSCLITGKTPNVASHRSSSLYITWGFCTTSTVVNFTVVLLLVESCTQLISWLYKFTLRVSSSIPEPLADVRSPALLRLAGVGEAGGGPQQQEGGGHVGGHLVTCHVSHRAPMSQLWPLTTEGWPGLTLITNSSTGRGLHGCCVILCLTEHFTHYYRWHNCVF